MTGAITELGRICLLAALLLGAASPGLGATLEVPGDHATIQEAVDAAWPGDLVLVQPGTYPENLLLAEGVDVLGAEGPTATVIDGTSSGITVRATNLTSGSLEGFHVVNGSGWNLRTDGCGPGLTVWGNVFEDSSACNVDLSGSSILLACNLIIGAGNHGIHCIGGDASTLIHNTIVDSASGGITCSGTSPLIRDNIITGGSYGIWVTSGGAPTVDYNDVWGNATADYSGIAPGPHDISADPLFVTGTYGNHYLSQIRAGQGVESPAVEAGSGLAFILGLAGRTTCSDDGSDRGIVDLGFHYRIPTPTVTPEPTPTPVPDVPATGGLGLMVLLGWISLALVGRRR